MSNTLALAALILASFALYRTYRDPSAESAEQGSARRVANSGNRGREKGNDEPTLFEGAALASSKRIGGIAHQSVFKLRVRRSESAGIDRKTTSYFGQEPIGKDEEIGSAFAIRSEGWLVTDYHVVQGSEEIQVIDAEDQTHIGKLVAFDSLTDLAVLRIDREDLSPLEWGDSDKAIPGSMVWVAGAPFGMQGSLSAGIISSRPRPALDGSPMREYLQTDAAINPGSSGGPVFDANGQVIGIATAILGDDFRGVGFALPSNVAKEVCAALIDSGKVTRGTIGGKWSRVTLDRALKAGLERPSGVYLESIDRKQSQNVLKVGDVCVEFGGQRIQGLTDFTRTVAAQKPQTVVPIVLYRNGNRIESEIRIESEP